MKARLPDQRKNTRTAPPQGEFRVSGNGEDCLNWIKPGPELARRICDKVVSAIFCYDGGAEDKLSSATEDIINPTSYEAFRGGLGALNAAITGNVNPFTDEDPSCISNERDLLYAPPPPKMQEEYFRKLAETLPTMENARDKAALAYYMIVGLHPFVDGNGRTARLAHELILRGKDLREEEIENIATHNKAESGASSFALLNGLSFDVLVNREVAKDVLGAEFTDKFGQITTNSHKKTNLYFAKDKPIAKRMLREDATRLTLAGTEAGGIYFPTNGIVLARLIQEYPELGSFASDDREYFGRDLLNGMYYGDMFMEDKGKSNYLIRSSYNGIEDVISRGQARRMLEIYDEVKAKYLDVVIDMFVNPGAHVAKKSGKTYADIIQEADGYSLVRNIGTGVTPGAAVLARPCWAAQDT